LAPGVVNVRVPLFARGDPEIVAQAPVLGSYQRAVAPPANRPSASVNAPPGV